LPSVGLYVNGEDIRYRLGMDTPLRPGDELVVLLPVAGGAVFRVPNFEKGPES
jgi:hypothetical protein